MSRSVFLMCERANNLALLNAFLAEVKPASRRKRAIMSLYENDVISAGAVELLFEHYKLEAA